MKNTAKELVFMSADKMYFIMSTISYALGIVGEILCIYRFLLEMTLENLGVLLIFQLAAAIAFLQGYVLYSAYANRRHFSLYIIENNATIYNFSPSQYRECFSDDYGTVFVDKNDFEVYKDWKLFHSFISTSILEKQGENVK